MTEGHHNSWLESCKAASKTKSSDEFRELHEILECEEWRHSDSDNAVRTSKSIEESPC
jgi:hypothetical protein